MRIELITISFMIASVTGADTCSGEVVEFQDEVVEACFEEGEQEEPDNEQEQDTAFDGQEWDIQSSSDDVEQNISEAADDDPVIIEYTESYQDMAWAGEGYAMSDGSLQSLVIVKTDGLLDMFGWSAEKIVAGPDSHYVLQFLTEIDAQTAVDLLLANEHDECCLLENYSVGCFCCFGNPFYI